MKKHLAYLTCLLALLLLPLSGIANTKHIHKKPICFSNCHSYQLPFYTRVVVNGPMQVNIIPCPTAGMQVTTDPCTYRFFNAVVVNQTLYLYMTQPPPKEKICFGPIFIKLNRNQISQIVDYGCGNITACNMCGSISVWQMGSGNIYLYGQNLNLQYLQACGCGNFYARGLSGCGLNITGNGTGHICLSGTVNLQNLRYFGNGSLSLYWINSPYVSVYAGGYGRIYLAGVTGTLDAVLLNHSDLNARFLRADTAFVQTCGCALAEVYARRLNTAANGNSNIYYYRNLNFAGIYMNPPAATLNMTNLN